MVGEDPAWPGCRRVGLGLESGELETGGEAAGS